MQLAIYLPDEIHQRMKKLQRRINWSRVAQDAFSKVLDDEKIYQNLQLIPREKLLKLMQQAATQTVTEIPTMRKQNGN